MLLSVISHSRCTSARLGPSVRGAPGPPAHDRTIGLTPQGRETSDAIIITAARVLTWDRVCEWFTCELSLLNYATAAPRASSGPLPADAVASASSSGATVCHLLLTSLLLRSHQPLLTGQRLPHGRAPVTFHALRGQRGTPSAQSREDVPHMDHVTTGRRAAHQGPPPDEVEVDITTGEGLRTALGILSADEAWRTCPLATRLLAYAKEKYAPLARSWNRDPGDAVYEAFLVMRAPATRAARDPWAVVTRAVELGIAAETHAERLLTSPDKARRPALRPDSDPVRAGEHEEFLFHHLNGQQPSSDGQRVDDLIRQVAIFLVMTGWPPGQVEPAVAYLCQRLGSMSSRESALDVLRKDLAMPVRLGWQVRAWAGLIRILLGTPHPRHGQEYGALARLLAGASPGDLLADAELEVLARRTATWTRP